MRRAAIVLLVSLVTQANAQEPKIESGRVAFPASGRVVQFKPHTVVHRDPEVAAAKGEAVDVQRSAVLIPAWKRVLVRSVSRLYEGSTEEITVYDYSGTKIGSTRAYLGPIFLAPVERRMFACEVSFHYGTTHAYLIDETGAVRSTIEHLGEPSDCFTTDDQRFVVIISMVARQGVPFTADDPFSAWSVVASVFDFDGNAIARLESDTKATQGFEAGGRRYEVSLPKPAPPG